MRLCVMHNLYFFNSMMEEIRQAIEEDRFHAYKAAKLDGFLHIGYLTENEKFYIIIY